MQGTSILPVFLSLLEEVKFGMMGKTAQYGKILPNMDANPCNGISIDYCLYTILSLYFFV